MKIIFFIESTTINLEKYTIKDIPGSSGRLDVISRCILAALLRKDKFDHDVKVWAFLGKFGTLIFDPLQLNYETFPKTEILLTDYIVSLIKGISIPERNNFDLNVQISQVSLSKALDKFMGENYECYILDETGNDFFKELSELCLKPQLLFIIGDQSGNLITSTELLRFNFHRLSLGRISYLASSVIRIIKMNLKCKM